MSVDSNRSPQKEITQPIIADDMMGEIVLDVNTVVMKVVAEGGVKWGYLRHYPFAPISCNV
jgi:hypothetical protein